MNPTLNTRLLNQEKTGTPLVLVHGLFGAGENLMGIARAFGNRPVALVDLRNHGRSFHSVSMTQREMAEDVAQVIRGLGWHKVDYIGHSLGGKVGIQLSQDFPQLLRKLVIADIAPVNYPPGHGEIFAALDAVNPEHVDSRREADQLMQPHVAEAGIRGFLLMNLVRAKEGGFDWRCNIPAMKANYEHIRQAPDFVKGFQGATLYIAGGNSDYILPEHHSDIMRYHPNAIIRTLPDTGHWLHAEKPHEFNQWVVDFLGDS